jgi:hypothetical protein
MVRREKSPAWDRNLAPDFHRCYRLRLPILFGIRPSGAVNAVFVWGPNLEITDLNTLFAPSDPKFGCVTL